MDLKLDLYRVTPAGVVSTTRVFTYHYDGGPNHPYVWQPGTALWPHRVVPDSLGGIIATWHSRVTGYVKTATRFDAEGVRSDYVLSTSDRPGQGFEDIAMAGDDGTVYVESNYGGTLTAMDVRTWTPKWTSTGTGLPVMALAGGGVILKGQGGADELWVTDSNGTTTETAATGLQPALGVAALEYGFWQGVSRTTGALAEVAGPRPVEALFSFLSGASTVIPGNRQGQGAATDLRQGIFAKTHDVVDGTKIRHIAIRIVPTNQAFWRAQEPSIFNRLVPGSDNLYFGTLGAGPIPESPTACTSSVLSAAFNRTTDWQKPPAIRLERLRLPVQGEDAWIESLIRMQRNYIEHHNDEVDYACPPIFPWEDGWNSNSYARGLLEAADVPLPYFPYLDNTFRVDAIYPGWYKPVPSDKFQEQP